MTKSTLRLGKMLGSADLQLVTLRLLCEKPRHGYDVIKAVEDHSSRIYAPSPGMVYPALAYLEEVGYAAVHLEGTKKLYNITGQGREHLRENQAVADEIWRRLAISGRKLAHFQQQLVEEEDVADRFGADSHGHSRSEWLELKAQFRALRDELKAALWEKLHASKEENARVIAILRRAIDDIRRGK